MHSQTEQLLGTLEVLNCSAYVYKITPKAEFNLWNLMRSTGIVTFTDLDLVIEHWQNIEEWGTPTDPSRFYEYAPLRSERKGQLWNETIAKERLSFYQELLVIIQGNIPNFQGYNLAFPYNTKEVCEWEHPDYRVPIMAGKIQDNCWLCLSSTVPDQVSFYGWRGNRPIIP